MTQVIHCRCMPLPPQSRGFLPQSMCLGLQVGTSTVRVSHRWQVDFAKRVCSMVTAVWGVLRLGMQGSRQAWSTHEEAAVSCLCGTAAKFVAEGKVPGRHRQSLGCSCSCRSTRHFAPRPGTHGFETSAFAQLADCWSDSRMWGSVSFAACTRPPVLANCSFAFAGSSLQVYCAMQLHHAGASPHRALQDELLSCMWERSCVP